MKTSGDVCKMFGITRKTLRGYVDIGLVQPAEKTGAGYWLYDDDSVRTIAFIQLMIECGYKRKEIKEKFFGRQEIDIKEELEEAKKYLMEKKSRIDEKINEIDVRLMCMDFYDKLPDSVLCAMQNINFAESFHKNYAKLSQEFTDGVKKLKNSDLDSNKDLMPLILQIVMLIISIGLLKKKDENSNEVLSCVALCEEYVWQFIIQLNEPDDIKEQLEEITDKEFGAFIVSVCLMFLEAAREYIDSCCDSGTYEFIQHVFKMNRLKKPVQN